MARMSIDDMIARDTRVDRLAKLCGWSRRETRACLEDVWALCYDRVVPYLPAEDIEVTAARDAISPPPANGFTAALRQVGLARDAAATDRYFTRKDGTRVPWPDQNWRDRVYLAGAAERVGYLLSKRSAGSEGGVKSGQSRRSKTKQSFNSASSKTQAPGNPPDPVPDSAPDLVPDPVPEDPDLPLPRAIPPTPVPRPAPPTTPAPGPSVPAVSTPAPAREDIARTQPAGTPATRAPDPKLDEIVQSRPDLVHRPTTNRVDEIQQTRPEVVHRDAKPSNAIRPGEPTLEQLWTELEQARQRAASARGAAIRPLVAHDTGRKDLAEALVEAARVGKRAELVADVRHAIAAAEAESRVAPEPGKRDQLPFFTGAIFSPRNFRRLAGTPVKAPKARPSPSGEQRRAVEADPPLTAEDRAAMQELRAKLATNPEAGVEHELSRGRASTSPSAKPTAELVRMFGNGERAPPASAATEPPTDDETRTRRKATT